MINFKEYIKQKKVIKCEPDLQKSKSLIKMSQNNFSSIKKIPLTNQYSSIIFTQIYECLRQIIEAIALKEGFKVYSHEAYTHYLKDKKEISIAEKFDRYRKLRNGINYYGKAVTTQITKEAIYQINKIIEKLKDKYV